MCENGCQNSTDKCFFLRRAGIQYGRLETNHELEKIIHILKESSMGIISWIIVGGIAGWVAGLIMKGSGSGLLMNIIIGIVGAFIGGLIMNMIGNVGVTGFNIWSLLVSVLGAVILLGIVGLFRRGRAS